MATRHVIITANSNTTIMSFNKTLLENFEYQGIWWLPETPDVQVSGTLIFDSERDIKLELLGTLYAETDHHSLFDNRGSNHRIIFGVTKEGQEVTLYNNVRSNSIFSFGGISSSAFLPSYAFVGAHITSVSDELFPQISISFTYFEEWIGLMPFRSEMIFDNEQSSGLLGMNASYRRHHSLDVSVPHLKSTMKVFHGFSTDGNLYRTMAWSHTAYLEIIPDEPRNFDWFLAVSYKMRDLLTLFVTEPVYPKQLLLWTTLENEEQPRTDTVHVLFSQRRKLQHTIHPHDMLVKYQRVEPSIETILENYFSKREKLDSVYQLLLGTLYNTGMYAQFQFLSLMQAVETFHRRMYEGKYISKQLYKNLQEKLVSANDEVFIGMTAEIEKLNEEPGSESAIKSNLEELHKVINGRLNHGNQVSLQTRLKQIFNDLTESDKELITTNAEEFIKYVVRTRDYFTHYGEEGKRKNIRSIDLFNALLNLRILLTILLLKELGIDENLRKEVITNNRKFQHSRFSEVEYGESNES